MCEQRILVWISNSTTNAILYIIKSFIIFPSRFYLHLSFPTHKAFSQQSFFKIPFERFFVPKEISCPWREPICKGTTSQRAPSQDHEQIASLSPAPVYLYNLTSACIWPQHTLQLPSNPVDIVSLWVACQHLQLKGYLQWNWTTTIGHTLPQKVFIWRFTHRKALSTRHVLLPEARFWL